VDALRKFFLFATQCPRFKNGIARRHQVAVAIGGAHAEYAIGPEHTIHFGNRLLRRTQVIEQRVREDGVESTVGKRQRIDISYTECDIGEPFADFQPGNR
jgi:ATP-dependent Zn protease